MVKRQLRQAKQVFNLKAIDGERNIDVFADKGSGTAKTVYFRSSRDMMAKGDEHMSRPDYKLEEVRKYVLGTIYIWYLKDSISQNIAA